MFQFGNASVNIQSQPQQQQQQMQNQQPLGRMTRVSDLPADAQTLIEQLDQHILQQISISDQFTINSDKLQEERDSITADVEEVQKRSTRTKSSLQVDQKNLMSCRDKLETTSENIRKITRLIDGLSSGNLHLRIDYLLVYFHEVINQLELDADAYAKIVVTVESHVTKVRAQESPENAAMLINALKNFHSAFLAVSSKTALANDQVQTITSSRTS